MQYLVESKGKKQPVLTLQELEAYLERIRKGELPDFFLTQMVGSMKSFERFLYKSLGLNTEIKAQSVSVLTKTDISSVTFLDEDFNESRAINADSKIPSGTIEFILETGEKSIHSADECIPTELALRAVRDFFEHGKKPTWLQYRTVKS